VELQPGDTYLYHLGERILGIKDPSLYSLEAHATTLNSLTLKQYNNICYWSLVKNRKFTVSTRATVELGAVYFCPSSDKFEDAAAIALLPSAVDVNPWYTYPRQAVVVRGWTRSVFRLDFAQICDVANVVHFPRLDASDAFDTTLHLNCRPGVYTHLLWTSQANYIFSRLQITSNFQDYGEVLCSLWSIKSLLTHSRSPCTFCPLSGRNFEHFKKPSPRLPISLP
jgi:hypothetical protein